MSENQYLDTPLDVNLNVYKLGLDKYVKQIEEVQKKIPAKEKYQFQELTKKLFPFYGSKIFQLPYRIFYSDYKLEIAHKKTEQFCKDPIKENRFKYLISCMKKLPY